MVFKNNQCNDKVPTRSLLRLKAGITGFIDKRQYYGEQTVTQKA